MMNGNQWEELLQAGISLSSYKKLDELLDRIVNDSIRILQCEGASIYIKRAHSLEFMTSHNAVLEKKHPSLGKTFQRFSINISNTSIAGYVSLSSEILNIDNVYFIDEEKPYRFNNTFDELYDYHTVSMLTIPMLDNRGELIGILQLINRHEGNKIIPFSENDIFVSQYLSSIAAMAIKNTSFNELLKNSYLDTVGRLALASEFRDLETSHHIQRMSEYSALLWRKIGYHDEDEILNAKYAAQMHDIGKIGIPDRILQKPGPLTDEERKVMEQHTIIGAKIVENSSSPLLELSRVVALTHHEKWDGTGYPYKLKGHEIPVIGRVVAITDVFDALSSKRVYKPAFSIEKVVEIMNSDRGSHFDPEILDLFFNSMPEVMEIYNRYLE